jgi:hypothetical protein
LEPYSGLVSADLNEYLNDESKFRCISLKEAASIQSANTGSTIVSNILCNCGTICKGDNRCKCFKNGQKCTSHCHGKMAKGKKKMCKNC